MIMNIDNTPIKVELTSTDIDWIIEVLEYSPHNLYVFMNYDKIINKLKKAKQDYDKNEICICGHHSRDHSYDPTNSNLANLECDICSCKDYMEKEK